MNEFNLKKSLQYIQCSQTILRIWQIQNFPLGTTMNRRVIIVLVCLLICLDIIGLCSTPVLLSKFPIEYSLFLRRKSRDQFFALCFSDIELKFLFISILWIFKNKPERKLHLPQLSTIELYMAEVPKHWPKFKVSVRMGKNNFRPEQTAGEPKQRLRC